MCQPPTVQVDQSRFPRLSSVQHLDNSLIKPGLALDYLVEYIHGNIKAKALSRVQVDKVESVSTDSTQQIKMRWRPESAVVHGTSRRELC